jgi:hypothetical protein
VGKVADNGREGDAHAVGGCGRHAQPVHQHEHQQGCREAHRKAEERAKRPGPQRFTEEVRLDAEEKLRRGWTPEEISGRAAYDGRPHVCKETIYKHVYAGAKVGGNLWTHLPQARRDSRAARDRDTPAGGGDPFCLSLLPCETDRPVSNYPCPEHEESASLQPVASVALATGWRGGV